MSTTENGSQLRHRYQFSGVFFITADSDCNTSKKRFTDLFYDYVNPYRLEDDDGINISYVVLKDTDSRETEGPEMSYTANVIVQYHSSHRPFPLRELSALEAKLKRKVEALNKQMEDMKQTYLIERNRQKRAYREVYAANEKLIKTNLSLRKKIGDLYERSAGSILDDCPVCYEGITPQQLTIKNCSHSICQTCSSRCIICPECREPY